MIRSVLVAGGGSAGLIAAMVLKKKLPRLAVTVVRSKEIGVIGVGESTTAAVPRMLHGYLELDPGEFYRAVMPSWKLGVRLLWGPRPFFDYTFDLQMDVKWEELKRNNGYYCDDDFSYVDMSSSLMSHNKVFLRQADGTPLIMRNFGYHIENQRFVAYLEQQAAAGGVALVDDVITDVSHDATGVTGLRLASGQSAHADLYVDCSGFRSALLGQALAEPFIPFRSTLFCDRAIVGTWMRTDEIIQPYTTAETMSAGWCWRIDHPDCIMRGYVYSSAFISDEAAEQEFRTNNPKVTNTRIINFVSGRYERAWVKNVVAIGNSAGFVEPLESTSLVVICDESRLLAQCLDETDGNPTPCLMAHYNQINAGTWDMIRDFLGVHYKFNTSLDTAFWRAARADVELGPVRELVDYYRAQGPSTFARTNLIHINNMFDIEGYLVLLVGQKVPHNGHYAPTADEWRFWHALRARNRSQAENGFGVREALEMVSAPTCVWKPGYFRASGAPRMTSFIGSVG